MLESARNQPQDPVPTRGGVLPDFLILGAQKGGTSSLYRYLRQHPQIAFASKKEVHYFDHHYDRGIEWYRSHFPAALGDHGGHQVVGEATPSYLFVPEGAERARETVPEARLIVLLRDPVDRAYSQFQHNRRLGRENRPFRQAVERRIERIARGPIEWPAHGKKRLRLHRKSYVERGLYAEQIERWWRFFPRERMLILDSASLFADPVRALEEVREHLGVGPFDWEASKATKRAFNQYSYEPIGEEDRRFLAEYFQEPNRRLYELVGRDFAW